MRLKYKAIMIRTNLEYATRLKRDTIQAQLDELFLPALVNRDSNLSN